MSQRNNDPGNFDGEEKTSENWKRLFFSDYKVEKANHLHWIADGPLGTSRRASSEDLRKLGRSAEEKENNYLRLLDAYAIAHNPRVEPVDMGRLSMPLGLDSPNLLCLGRSGSGKTQSVMLPAALHALERGWNVVYHNVKGCRQTRILERMAEQFGRIARVMCPKDLSGATCTLIEDVNTLADAAEVSQAMVAAAAKDARKGESAWYYNGAEEFISNAILAVCKDLPPEQRTLQHIRTVVQSGDYIDFAERHPNFPVLKRFSRYYNENKNGDTLAGAIAECTAFVDNSPEFLARSTFSFQKFAQHGGFLIFQLDQSDVNLFMPYSTVFLTRLIAAFQRAANRSPTGALNKKTLFIVDELPASGPIPGFANVLQTCRELNYCFVAGAQSISQLADTYDKKWESVLNGFQTQLVLGGGLDWSTAEIVSRRTGVGTIALANVQDPGDAEGDVAVSRNWQMSSRPIFLPSEIASPAEHPLLGMPSTILCGDGRTPAFQAFLTPIHKHGAFRKIIEDVHQLTDDACDKKTTQNMTSRNSDAENASALSDTSKWPEWRLEYRIAELHELVVNYADLNSTHWWDWLASEHADKKSTLVRLLEELVMRKANLSDLLYAVEHCDSDSIEVALAFLDYQKAKERRLREVKKSIQPSLIKPFVWEGVEVILESVGQSNPRALATVVRKLRGLSRKDTKKLLEKSLPISLGFADSTVDANEAVSQLQRIGCEARFQPEEDAPF